jgi:hypothetical protein
MNLSGTMWVIYDHPEDCPTHYVVRGCLVDRGRVRFALDHRLFVTLEDARESLFSSGLVCIPRHKDDDPCIVESWI